jgi:hypothetical protein
MARYTPRQQRAQKLMFSCLTSLLQFLVASLCRLRIFARFCHYVGADNNLTRKPKLSTQICFPVVGHGGIGGGADKARVPGHDGMEKGTHVMQRPRAPSNVNGNAKEEWNKDENRSKSSNVGIRGGRFRLRM